MFNYIAWAVLVLVIVFLGFSLRLSVNKRLHLNSYVVYLLLDDNVRNKHQHDFVNWLKESTAQDRNSLYLSGTNVLEDMADRLAGGDGSSAYTSSTLGAPALMWDIKTGKQ